MLTYHLRTDTMPLISALILGGTPLRYKLQVILADTEVPTTVEINSAHVHDVHFLEQLKLLQLFNCQIIVDKGYLSLKHRQELVTTHNISFITPIRINMKKNPAYARVHISVFEKNGSPPRDYKSLTDGFRIANPKERRHLVWYFR